VGWQRRGQRLIWIYLAVIIPALILINFMNYGLDPLVGTGHAVIKIVLVPFLTVTPFLFVFYGLGRFLSRWNKDFKKETDSHDPKTTD
tara:strand:- start:146 stop:409 length:264 start_codon:yes stop_codon:yes gene_type:complete